MRHHWRMHLAVAAAVAVATAVLTGALVVGASVRGSLRNLTLQRLGTIDLALATPSLFRAELAGELANTDGFDEHFKSAIPMLSLRGSATSRTPNGMRRANELDIYGVTDDFWAAGQSDPREDPSAAGIWLTDEVANDLNASAGDEVLLRLPLQSNVPADSPLGEKADTIAGRRFTVAGVLANNGLARFGLRPSQRPPRAVFAPLEQLADAIDQPGKANTLLVTGFDMEEPAGEVATEWLDGNFKPTLADYGLAVEQLESGAMQLSSEGLVLPDEIVDTAERTFADDRLQPITTYLANTIRVGDQSISYSTVTGVDSIDQLGPLINDQGAPITIGLDEIVLNRWAADQLDAKIGDTAILHYYEPESTHGKLREHQPPLELKVVGIVELADQEGNPAAAADASLTPELKGVTDQESIADWDLPFELTEPITQADEDYWDEFRTTPKAFVAPELADKIWSTRWGSVSLLRILPSDDLTVDDARRKLRDAIRPADLGLAFLPVKRQGLAAAGGTTPFDALFLGFSMFLIAAAVMLVVLLFRLAIEGRVKEIGLLAALGFTAVRSRQLLWGEAIVVAAAGALIGALLGVAYAWIMVAGLTTLWVAAISAPFIELHVGRWSLPIGFLVGLLAAAATTWLAIRTLLHESPRSLLAGMVDERQPQTSGAASPRKVPVAEMLLSLAVLIGAWAATLRGEAQAGAFFGVGALALAGTLAMVRRRLTHRAAERSNSANLSLGRLAAANLARKSGRSTLTIGLVASASFLLLAISSFRLAPSNEGTGGYDWFATSDVPIHYDANDPEGRLQLGFSDKDELRLADCTIDSLRVEGGEDASCLNLYRTAQPRILGVRDAKRVLEGFAWSATSDDTPDLDTDLGVDANTRAVVPVVVDFNTAMYSLHLSGGIGDRLTVRDEDDQPVTLEVVGLLKNSILQGDLMVSDDNFRRLFPTNSGSRLFLIREDDLPSSTDPIDEMLEDRLSDYGLAVTWAPDRLARFLAVQNTYLSTFQAIGGLGLILGTIGLAVVQLRGVLERRGELALLQAVGFTRRRIVWLVLAENLLLLTGGLAIGGLAALLALLPQMGVYGTSLPWQTMMLLIAVILVVGAVATWLSTRQVLRDPILASLRGD